MKKRTFGLLSILGAALILLSVILLLAFWLRMGAGAEESQKIAATLEQLLPERTAGVPGMSPNTGMPVLELEGTDYAALVEIPGYGLVLPVADRWDPDRLYNAPARFTGSVYDSTLVIGGADAAGQLDFCDTIPLGAQIAVTDMTGARFTYTVCRVDRAKHAQPQWLSDADSDLTFFCHALYSMEYIAVRCVSSG